MALENLENVFKKESPQIGDIEKNIATKKPVEIEPIFDSVFDAPLNADFEEYPTVISKT